MIVLHHSPTTRSFRIKWLLEELALPYREIVRDFYNMERHDPEYRRVNPIGSFPTIEDGSVILTESGAIINHILRHHGGSRFIPARGSREESMVDEWMYWSEGLFAVHQRIYWDHCALPPAASSIRYRASARKQGVKPFVTPACWNRLCAMTAGSSATS